MRQEPFTVGSYIHVYNRGHRKQNIARDERDRWRFILMLRYFNDEYASPHFIRDLVKMWRKSDFLHRLDWPETWPAHEPLVRILSFSIMPNHFHLLIKEIKERGTSKFMQKFGIGATKSFNAKYTEVGSLFQGGYRVKTVDKDAYLKDLSVYIQIKNPFELYPGGLQQAIKEFDKAYEFAIRSPYNSLADYAGQRNSPIIDRDILGEVFATPEDYKEFARDAMMARALDEELDNLTFDDE